VQLLIVLSKEEIVPSKTTVTDKPLKDDKEVDVISPLDFQEAKSEIVEYDRKKLKKKSKDDLIKIVKNAGIQNPSSKRKSELVNLLTSQSDKK